MKLVLGILSCFVLISCQEIDNKRVKENSNNEVREEKTVKVLTFEQDVSPLLKKSCLPCHNNKNLKDWTDYDLVVEYSDAILRSLNHEAHYNPMPMGKPKLADSEIELIKEWVESGMARGEVKLVNLPKNESGNFAKDFYENKCSSCHDDNQNYPGLKGQPKEYIVTQLEDFKTGHRTNPTMNYFANDIIKDQETVEALAQYLSELKPCYEKTKRVAIKKLSGDKEFSYENGKKFYEKKCLTCHTDNLMNTPNVFGLNGNYLVKVLINMKTNYRPSTAMGRVLLDTSRQEILDVSYYLSKQSNCEE